MKSTIPPTSKKEVYRVVTKKAYVRTYVTYMKASSYTEAIQRTLDGNMDYLIGSRLEDCPGDDSRPEEVVDLDRGLFDPLTFTFESLVEPHEKETMPVNGAVVSEQNSPSFSENFEHPRHK